ncbi:uncharacterized protein B4U79_17626 [Dinothrombium tinctorium]|uniref:Tudor domain-containing protein n=1 Tax=Dinothrombium tinctorium TaxID=1965070 RepID=A0A443R505_9ACAR|nr:uncharacterized protein B4U79_17663 [Dinothrombium tinctorium]RWS10106.1 uncharacterized protein B4U79_17645 [Dinothrombium tinctorium]RWS10351.1 uncharacterized protein B4U79_17626 [Dinothrombium tinctorium]
MKSSFQDSRIVERVHSTGSNRAKGGRSGEQLLRIPELDIREGAYREVIITKISSPNNFYVRITEYENDLKEMRASMAKEYSRSNNSDFRPQKHSLVALIPNKSHRGAWQRGIVHDVNSMRIELVDTGGVAFRVPPTFIRRLDAKYFELPKLAIKCALTEEDAFTYATLNRFRDDFIDCRFLAHFKKKDINNHRYLIVLLHYEMIRTFDMFKIFIDKVVTEVKTVNLLSDDFVEVKLLTQPSEVDNTFYIKKVENSNPEELKLLNEISIYYSKLPASKLNIDVLKPSEVYVCEHKGKWFRARFQSFTSEEEDECIILLIDEGQVVSVKRERVKHLLDCYAVIPPQAICCRFSKELGWPSKVPCSPNVHFKCKFVSKDDNNCYTIEYPLTVIEEKNKIVQKIELMVPSKEASDQMPPKEINGVIDHSITTSQKSADIRSSESDLIEVLTSENSTFSPDHSNDVIPIAEPCENIVSIVKEDKFIEKSLITQTPPNSVEADGEWDKDLDKEKIDARVADVIESLKANVENCDTYVRVQNVKPTDLSNSEDIITNQEVNSSNDNAGEISESNEASTKETGFQNRNELQERFKSGLQQDGIDTQNKENILKIEGSDDNQQIAIKDDALSNADDEKPIERIDENCKHDQFETNVVEDEKQHIDENDSESKSDKVEVKEICEEYEKGRVELIDLTEAIGSNPIKNNEDKQEVNSCLPKNEKNKCGVEVIDLTEAEAEHSTLTINELTNSSVNEDDSLKQNETPKESESKSSSLPSFFDQNNTSTRSFESKNNERLKFENTAKYEEEYILSPKEIEAQQMVLKQQSEATIIASGSHKGFAEGPQSAQILREEETVSELDEEIILKILEKNPKLMDAALKRRGKETERVPTVNVEADTADTGEVEFTSQPSTTRFIEQYASSVCEDIIKKAFDDIK